MLDRLTFFQRNFKLSHYPKTIGFDPYSVIGYYLQNVVATLYGKTIEKMSGGRRRKSSAEIKIRL
jgi:hypothetical protein